MTQKIQSKKRRNFHFFQVPGAGNTTARPSTSWSLAAASVANGAARSDATRLRRPWASQSWATPRRCWTSCGSRGGYPGESLKEMPKPMEVSMGKKDGKSSSKNGTGFSHVDFVASWCELVVLVVHILARPPNSRFFCWSTVHGSKMGHEGAHDICDYFDLYPCINVEGSCASIMSCPQ